MPADRVTARRRAFDATFTDPGFLAHGARSNLDIVPRRGEEIQALVDKLYASAPAIVARAREVVK